VIPEMARIPEEEIQRLKREVSLERLVEVQGIELRRHGGDRIGLCPFHDDRSPSLVVTPAKNLWYCLGACQEGGSVIDWVMKLRGVSFRHAVEILRSDAPPVPTNGNGRRVLPSPVTTEAEDREVLAQVVDYYHETLKQSPEALGYLEGRGLKSSDAIDHFQLGFANRTLGYRLPGAKARERLQRLGVLRKTGHEHLNGSLVVPVFGESGEVVGMYGRKVTPEYKLRKGTPLHLYLPGPHRGVFNSSALQSNKTVILCEALLDALTFWCAGFRNVTASYGVEGFTAQISERTRLGGRTTSKFDFNYDGNISADLLGRVGVETELTMAAIARVGLSHDINQHWSVHATWGWDNWSEMDDIFITTNVGGAVLPRSWDDTYHYAVGADYRLDQRWTLRAGIAYDTDPVDPKDRTADMPLDEQYRYAVGFDYLRETGMRISASLVYADYGEAEIDSQRVPPLFGLEGDYKSNEIWFANVSFNWQLGGDD